MSYQALARKWRPQRFSELVGQEHIVRALQHALDNDRLHHALLFSGTRGVGKTTLGRLVAKGLNCTQGVTANPCGECEACLSIEQGRFVDLIEVDAASRTGVDDTRDLLNNVQYAPAHGRCKVYLIDEVHMLSKSSFNALLKTLEEPPEHVRFLLATTDPQKLPVTVLSRCLQFHLKRLPRREIQGRLEAILNEESVAYEGGATELLAQAADGSLRDGISLLDQAIAFGHGQLQTQEVAEMLGSIARQDVLALIETLGQGDGQALYTKIEQLDAQAPDYAGVLDELASNLQRMAVRQLVPEMSRDDDSNDALLDEMLSAFSPEQLQLLYQIAITGKRDLPLAPDPRSGFEMTMLRMLAFRPASASTQEDRQKVQPAPLNKPSQTSVANGVETRSSPDSSGNGSVAVDSPASQEATHPQTRPVPTPGPETWAVIAEGLGLSGMAAQLALNCTWKDYQDSVFVLGLAPEHDAMFGAQYRGALIAAIRKCYGPDQDVQFEVVESATPTPAALADDATQRRQQQAAEALAQDPNVQALQERFGARVHEASIKAID